MDKLYGRDIDKITVENLNVANLNCLNSYKEMLDLIENMHKSISCEQLFDNNEQSASLLKLSDDLVSEMASIAQNYVKLTFLLDKMENMLIDSV